MPTIQLNDQFGAAVEIVLAPMSSLLQYVKAVPQDIISKTPLAQIGALTLSDPAVTSLTLALDFSQPFTLGTNLPELEVSAAAGASFDVIQRTTERTQIFPSGDYGENIPIPSGSCYVRFGLTAMASVGPSITTGSLTFGATAGSQLKLDNWRPFPAGAGAPLITDALGQCIAGFRIPASLADLAAIPAGQFVAVTVSGTLTFSATANLLAIANPLAAAALPAGFPALGVQQSAAVTVGAAWKIEADYQVRAQKTDAGKIRLGWYRRHSADFTVTASANAGLAAGTANTDFFATLITAISASPKTDLQALEAAGLPTSQVLAIQGAVQAAVDRKLQLALIGAIGALTADEAAFLFEIDPAAIDENGGHAILTALAGDLTGILTPRAGITAVRSIVSDTQLKHFSWRINLLGIYNFGSIAKLAAEGVVMFSDATGELLITDSATAARIGTGAINFGANDEKLVHVLAESFLITAAYRGSRAAIAGPKLSSSQVFFADEKNAGRDRLQAFLRDAAALAFHGSEPPETGSFGRTTLFLEADYDDALTQAMFLDAAGAAHEVTGYEAIGRESMQLLVDPKQEAFRLPPLTDGALWAQMKELGPPQFRTLFPEAAVGAVTADYLTIRWWADTMHGTAGTLARIKKFFAANPEAPPESAEFQKLRQQLADGLKDVAGKMPAEFGAPWGLVAMYLLTGGKAAARARIVSQKFVFSQERGA